MSRPRHAIIDIGSNSLRLVIFGGDPRQPEVLYDDKLAAGLGRGVAARGRLERKAAAQALATLGRYAALLRLVAPDSLQVVATAAVRDAADGPQFLDQVRALGLPARLLSGEEEAQAAAWGVIATHPGARGLVADLGGGSLELARIAGDQVHQCASFRLGIIPVAAIRATGAGRLRAALHAEYTLPVPGLALLGGARYSASKYASQAGNVEVGGYTVFDLGSRYRTAIGGYDTVLRLTVDNLFDKRYWRDTGDYLGDNYLFQGAPRTARLSASVSF